MKPVSGFKTEDGNFFETDVEALFYEAETRLKEAWNNAPLQQDTTDESGFIAMVELLAPQLKDYLDVHAAKSALDHKDPSAPEGIEAFLAQSHGGDGTVSDMGSGKQPKTISRSEPLDGVGVGGHDAPSVRGGTSVATSLSAELAEACRTDGVEIIREGAMDPLKKILGEEDK